MPAKKISREEARFYEAGPSEVCQDCGMRITPEVARFKYPNGQYVHAYTEQCIEGHGDSE